MEGGSDMAEFRELQVTDEDIREAIRIDSTRCVVARAVARTYPKARRIEVDLQTIRFTDGDGTRYAYLTPPAVQQYIIDFDAGDPIQPFKFRLHSRGRLIVSTQKRTPEGAAVAAADTLTRNRKRKVDALAKDPDATDAERTVAAEKLAKAQAARADVIAAVGDTPKFEPARHQPGLSLDDKGEVVAVVPTTRVPKDKVNRAAKAKRNSRHYGHRVLRENRDRFGLDPLTEGGTPVDG